MNVSSSADDALSSKRLLLLLLHRRDKAALNSRSSAYSSGRIAPHSFCRPGDGNRVRNVFTDRSSDEDNAISPVLPSVTVYALQLHHLNRVTSHCDVHGHEWVTTVARLGLKGILIAVVCLCVCVSVCLSVPRRMPTLLHVPGCNLGDGMGCSLVVHYWADLQSVHRFGCHGNICA